MLHVKLVVLMPLKVIGRYVALDQHGPTMALKPFAVFFAAVINDFQESYWKLVG